MSTNFKITLLASAVMASLGCSGMAFAQDVYNSNVIGGSTGSGSIDFQNQSTVQFNGGSDYSGVVAWHGGNSSISNVGSIILGGSDWQNGAFYALNNGTVNVTTNIGSIVSDPNGEFVNSHIFHSMGGTINVSVTDSVEISNVYNGLYSQRIDGNDTNSNISITAANTVRISAEAPIVSTNYNDEGTDDGYAAVNISAKTVELTATNGYAISARSAQYTDTIDYNDAYAGKATVSINASDRLVVTGADGYGAVFASNGRNENDVSVNLQAADITVNGDMNIDRKSQLKIGGEVDGFTANVTGNINATNNSNVALNLGNMGSFTGAVNRDTGAGTASTVDLDLGTASTWNVTQASSVSTLSGTGNMLLASKESTVAIDQLNGTVTAGFNGLTADDFTDAPAEVNEIIQVGKMTEDSTLTTKIAEGDLYDAITVTTKANGESAVTGGGTSSKLTAFQGITASSLVQWRNQINHITKRLGDVRSQPEGIGAWARVYGGQYEWGSGNTVEMTSTTVQAGADGRLGNWIIGGAFSYTDSRFDITNGNADGDMYSLAIYASRLFEGGSYVDIVGRYGYLKNEITAANMDIDTSSNAFGLSIEGGHQFRFMEQAYIEPQVELAYGFVEGTDDTASNSVKIDQDDYQSLTARVGFRTGFDFPENAGTIYAHFSYSYDFLGDADATASKAGVRPVNLDEDLGGGWVTYGIGGQFRIGESSFAYGELERSSGGDVDNPWAFNVGWRYVF